MREERAKEMGISVEEYRVKLAAAKVIGGFQMREADKLHLERGSVYGAAILMPQVARTVGWPKYLTQLVSEVYVYLIVNVLVQGMLLFMISKEVNVMQLFHGRMYLCDFGAHFDGCPGQPWCRGPGGTEVTPTRRQEYSIWSSKVFAKLSMLSLFPDKATEIEEKVDPGEYGLEDYACRLICCVVFLMTVMHELVLIWNTLRLIWSVPSQDEPWVVLTDEDEAYVWADAAEIKVAGMSASWKLLNLIVVFLPKLLLWKLYAVAGITFLMETSGIGTIINNSVALGFVLRIDEMFFEFMSEGAKHMLSIHDAFESGDEEQAQADMSEESIIQEYGPWFGQHMRRWGLRDLLHSLFPRGVVGILLLTLIFVGQYYLVRCDYVGGGHWISKPLYHPESVNFSPLNALFPSIFPHRSLPEHEWKMPPEIQKL